MAGSAEVDRDGDSNDAGELSSARTTIAGVPQVPMSKVFEDCLLSHE